MPTGMVRLSEGVRLWRQLPTGSQLIVSGGSLPHEPPIALGYAVAAESLGVPADAIIILPEATDTGMETRAIHLRIGDAPVLVVSSAAHMPRVMKLAALDDLQAIPAPTGNLSDPGAQGFRLRLVPSATALRKSETALHEYLGLLALAHGDAMIAGGARATLAPLESLLRYFHTLRFLRVSQLLGRLRRVIPRPPPQTGATPPRISPGRHIPRRLRVLRPSLRRTRLGSSTSSIDVPARRIGSARTLRRCGSIICIISMT